MAGQDPKQAQVQQEVAPGLPYLNNPEPRQAPGADLISALSALGSLGANIAGLSMGTGAQGQDLSNFAASHRADLTRKADRDAAEKERIDGVSNVRNQIGAQYNEALKLNVPKARMDSIRASAQSGDLSRMTALINDWQREQSGLASELRQEKRVGNSERKGLQTELLRQSRDAATEVKNIETDINKNISFRPVKDLSKNDAFYKGLDPTKKMTHDEFAQTYGQAFNLLNRRPEDLRLLSTAAYDKYLTALDKNNKKSGVWNSVKGLVGEDEYTPNSTDPKKVFANTAMEGVSPDVRAAHDQAESQKEIAKARAEYLKSLANDLGPSASEDRRKQAESAFSDFHSIFRADKGPHKGKLFIRRHDGTGILLNNGKK